MDFWGDLWAALTGIGTLALAIATFCVIRQSQGQREDAERQHRDQFKPICCLDPFGDLDLRSWRSDILRTIEPTPDSPAYGRIVLRGSIRNVGAGPAMKLRLRFRFLDMNGWTSEPHELPPLGRGDTLGNGAPMTVLFRISEHFNATDFSGLTGKPWEILLEYEDVFGRAFHSIHSKAPFDPHPATFSWTGTGAGEQPKATLRAIPWLTYVEGPLRTPVVEGRAS